MFRLRMTVTPAARRERGIAKEKQATTDDTDEHG
jgi:hypothetical protein